MVEHLLLPIHPRLKERYLMKVKPQETAATDTPATPIQNFDKLKIMKALRSATFNEDQAEAIVEAIDEAQYNLVTKDDLNQAVGGLRTDMEKMELRMRANMESMRANIQDDFKRLYWYIPAVMAAMVGILKIT